MPAVSPRRRGRAVLARGCARAVTPVVGLLALSPGSASGWAVYAGVPGSGYPPPLRAHSWGRGSWCWFGDPRAVFLGGPLHETVVGWIDPAGRVMVGAIDDTSGRRRTARVGWLPVDDHGSPAILVEPDRRLTVFWSGHDGSRMYLRSTLAPGDIGRWTPVREVPANLPGRLGFTYPNPVLLPAEHNRLILFWRGADWSADLITRSVAGAWGAPRELIRNPGERPYLKVAGDGRDRIALAFTNGHPRNTLTSVFYMGYRNGWLRHAAGRMIARLGAGPISPAAADVVYDARRTGISAWVWDVALAPRGNPVIVYATFPSPQHHLYWYARWSGRRWVSHLITVGGPTISPGGIELQYSGGLALDHGDPSVVYLSRLAGAHFRIERWATRDGGAHWRRGVLVASRSADEVRPVVARGSRGSARNVLWLSGRYGSYTSYHTTVQFLR